MIAFGDFAGGRDFWNFGRVARCCVLFVVLFVGRFWEIVGDLIGGRSAVILSGSRGLRSGIRGFGDGGSN